jgi:hypothetical protein
VLVYGHTLILRYEVNQRMNKHWAVTDVRRVLARVLVVSTNNGPTELGEPLTYICMQLMQFSQNRNSWSMLLISQFRLLWCCTLGLNFTEQFVSIGKTPTSSRLTFDSNTDRATITVVILWTFSVTPCRRPKYALEKRPRLLSYQSLNFIMHFSLHIHCLF